MRQTAPDPLTLHALVEQVRYKPGWRFVLEDIDRGQGSAGLTLSIYIAPPDAYRPDEVRRVVHYMPVPPAAFDIASWRRWLFEQILLVEHHEAMEFFRLGELRPYAPNHGPGNDPYTVRELTTDEQRRTSFTGVVKPAEALPVDAIDVGTVARRIVSQLPDTTDESALVLSVAASLARVLDPATSPAVDDDPDPGAMGERW